MIEKETFGGAPFKEILTQAPDGLEGVLVESKRPTQIEWIDYGKHFEMRVIIPATDQETDSTDFPPPIKVTIPLTHDHIQYTPSLTEKEMTVRTFPLSEYAFAKNNKRFGLPLSNGLLGIGPQMTLVLDQRSVYLAANIEKGRVIFEDRTVPAQAASEWRFRFYPEAAEKVVAIAFVTNVQRVEWWSLQ
ncbi:MAG TPA: hypothetical protein EYN06_10740 [Myxococcales bacterium]|nr:hypothetical protein [Myxococcales bacterium]